MLEFIKTKTHDSTFHGLAIDNDPVNGSYDRILESAYGILHEMVSRHQTVQALKFTLYLPSNFRDMDNNNHLKSFMLDLVGGIKSDGGDVRYLWVREQVPYRDPFYSCLVLVGDIKVACPDNWLSLIRTKWTAAVGMQRGNHLIRTDADFVVILDRQNPEINMAFRDYFCLVSKMARADTKPFSPYGCRQFAHSRIKHGKK